MFHETLAAKKREMHSSLVFEIKFKWGGKVQIILFALTLKAWSKFNKVLIIMKFTLFENDSKCRIWILAFSTCFYPIKSDLSGNTVWPQASNIQKLAKIDNFLAFLIYPFKM